MNSIIIVIGCSLFCIFNYFSYVNSRPKNNREQIKQRELTELIYFLKNSHRITVIISVATKISMITVLFILGQLMYYYCSIPSRVCEHYNADRMKSVGFTFGIVSAATSAMLVESLPLNKHSVTHLILYSFYLIRNRACLVNGFFMLVSGYSHFSRQYGDFLHPA